MKNIQDRLIELAIAKNAADKAKEAFVEKFSKGLDEAAKDYAAMHKLPEFDVLQEIGNRNGKYADLRQEVFECCHEEWEAMKAARQRLGSIKGGLMRSGQSLLKKQEAEEEERNPINHMWMAS